MVETRLEKNSQGDVVLTVKVLDSYGRDEVLADFVCPDKLAAATIVNVEWCPPEIEPIDLSIYEDYG